MCLFSSQLHSFCVAFCQHPGARGDLGQGEVEEQIIKQSWEGHSEFAVVCIVDLKAELFQQQNRNTLHDFSAYGKTLEKNHSLMSRFSQTEERPRLQNKITRRSFSGYRKSGFRRNYLSVEW